jgi:predicted alpha/beta-hydrolase family hydrolase
MWGDSQIRRKRKTNGKRPDNHAENYESAQIPASVQLLQVLGEQENGKIVCGLHAGMTDMKCREDQGKTGESK